MTASIHPISAETSRAETLHFVDFRRSDTNYPP